MQQLSLFDPFITDTSLMVRRGPLPEESECWLETFRAARVHDGAHPRSVAREVSQLRSLTREVWTGDNNDSVILLITEPHLVAHALCEPRRPVSRSTANTRFVAVQRFIQIVAPLVGRDPAHVVQALDDLLPEQRSVGWLTLGTVIAGSRTRMRRRGPTLEAEHLHALVDAAAENSTRGHAARDRALIALHCWSGLRPEEILRLRWEKLSVGRTSTDELRYAVTTRRAGREITLPILNPAIDALETLALERSGWIGLLTGTVFCAGYRLDRPLSYRAARDTVRLACRHAKIPIVEAAELRAAFAYWLKSQGLSDHEVAIVLGLRMVRSVDRLLTRHRQLNAQRRVREVLP